MYKTFFTIIFVWTAVILFTTQLIAQDTCVYEYNFYGPRGRNILDSIPVKTNDFFIIDFNTLNVPDRFVVYHNDEMTDSLEFFIGSWIITSNPQASEYRGYCEFKYENDTFDILINTLNYTPAYFSEFTYDITEGNFRLYYKVKRQTCFLKFKVYGNTEFSTIYNICIKKLSDGENTIRDTTIIPYCGIKTADTIDYGCYKELILYQDQSVVDSAIVFFDGCLTKTGHVEFLNYPEFNSYNLELGNHSITVFNDYCEKEFNFLVAPDTICDYYIPNVFSPNMDGENDIFTLYTFANLDYELFIYDRWGNLLFRKNCISGVTGWEGVTSSGELAPTGVYGYKIVVFKEIFYGDVTILK